VAKQSSLVRREERIDMRCQAMYILALQFHCFKH
jgi:hypothetical protein